MKYPIIQIFQNDKNIYAKEDGLAIASVNLMPIFVNSVILDSTGNVYRVKKAFRIGWAYFFGYSLLMKGRTAKIDFEFTEIEKYSLETLKELLVSKLQNGVERRFWYTEKNIPSLIARINQSEDYSSLTKIGRDFVQRKKVGNDKN
ncbi:MAG: hypothetical protein EOO45_02800, partial [Flavobacterium sp.]